MVHVKTQGPKRVKITTNKGKAIQVQPSGTVLVQIGQGTAYTGPYEVTPQATASTTLPTAGKTLARDVNVHPVPYWETSNDAGGTTVYIASGKEDM